MRQETNLTCSLYTYTDKLAKTMYVCLQGNEIATFRICYVFLLGHNCTCVSHVPTA
jgi:hypothetical protein